MPIAELRSLLFPSSSLPHPNDHADICAAIHLALSPLSSSLLHPAVEVQSIQHMNVVSSSPSSPLLTQTRPQLICICGSAFIMSQARKCIGIEEARDSDGVGSIGGGAGKAGEEKIFADAQVRSH
ncbi:hypothetical protein EON65_02910 [archaeon]|nr:MAG: hypothetical protein EON65_02910 [archaeon]